MSAVAETLSPNDIYEDGSAINFSNALHPETAEQVFEKSLIMKLSETAPSFDPAQFATDLKVATHFREVEGKYRLRRFVPIEVYRYRDKGERESYEDKLAKERQRGKENSAAYGHAELNRQEFVLFTTHWDHFFGTLDVDMGERFVRAATMAREKNLPLVAFFASAGARQQEGTPGLKQMPRMIEAIRKFKEETRMPYISIIGESWGGITASAATLGDVVVGMRGSGMGFAGPRVIEEAVGKKPPTEQQSVEQNFLDSNIDMVFNDQAEFLQWLNGMLKASSLIKKGKGGSFENIDLAAKLSPDFDQFPFGEIRIVNRMPNTEKPRRRKKTNTVEGDAEEKIEIVYPEDSYRQYEDLLFNPRRPDTEYYTQTVFDTFIPFYSLVAEKGKIHQKANISGFGIIGDQVFVVTGNQRSYYRGSDGTPRVIQGQLGNKDLRRRTRVLSVGARMVLPLVTMVTTFGARPAIDEERDGLSESIATTTLEGQAYPQVSATYIVGPYGSGGGIGSGQIGEVFVMLSGGEMYVAPPRSFTSILYNTNDPSREQIVKATHEAKVTAKDQLDLELIDEVIPEPSGGADRDPLETATRLRTHLVRSMNKYRQVSIKDRIQERSKKILSKRGGTIVELHD